MGWWDWIGSTTGSAWCSATYETFALLAVGIAVLVMACAIFGTMWAMFLTDQTRGLGVIPSEYYETLRFVIGFPLVTPLATVTLVLVTPFLAAAASTDAL